MVLINPPKSQIIPLNNVNIDICPVSILTTRRLGKPKKKRKTGAAVIKVKPYKKAKVPPKTKSANPASKSVLANPIKETSPTVADKVKSQQASKTEVENPVNKTSAIPVGKTSETFINKASANPIKKTSANLVNKTSANPVKNKSANSVKKTSANPVKKTSANSAKNTSANPLKKSSATPTVKSKMPSNLAKAKAAAIAKKKSAKK